jgi:hypothetical protein
MAVKNCRVEDMVASLHLGGSVTGLSVTDGCRWRAVIVQACGSAKCFAGQY